MNTPNSTLASAADLPSLDRLLNDPAFAGALSQYARSQVTAALRTHLDALRARALRGELHRDELLAEAISKSIVDALMLHNRPRLLAVFNLTGTVLHTNLGRAQLPEAAGESVARVLRDAVNLEFDLAVGARGDRDALVEPLLCELAGAEAATVVNNNAAGVMLVLNTLANRREVIVSRGELVEIGGAFRIPDVMRCAGAKLVEVGTTNRTHAADYADAIGARSSLLMKVHASNYAISGFTANVDVAELATIGRAHGLPVVVDLGSGSLVDLARWGLPHEPTVRETLAAGADIVAFSADKLLGGPQAGIIVGRADLIRRLKKNPLKRALRVGKLTLAALEPVLALYRAPELLAGRLTTLRLLTRSVAAIQAQAQRLLVSLQNAVGDRYDVVATSMASQIGSGALPVDTLASHGFSIRAIKAKRGSLDRLETAMRGLPKPVIGRISEKTLWLDLRCLEEAHEAAFMAQLHLLRQ
ncbi:MAG: L-seryl-tRNA(Sec) selenium transferase [Rudaea sp.]|nr:L-seryl-tRNA(Sec) selenium transferase [Rudaea sp.]